MSNDLIIFFTTNFSIYFYGFFFIDGFLMVITALWIGQHSHIKKMDEVFSGSTVDYGVWLNSIRAFSYGMSMLSPKILGKKVHKDTDISKIKNSDKWPFILLALSTLLLTPYFFFGIFLDFQKN